MMNITSMGSKIRGRLQGIKQRFIYYSHKLHIGHPYLALAMVFGLVFDFVIWILDGRGYSFALLVYTIVAFVYIFVPKIGSVALIAAYLLLAYWNCSGSEYAFIITVISFASVAFLFSLAASLCIIAVAFLAIWFIGMPDLNLVLVLILLYFAAYCAGHAIKVYAQHIVDEEAYKKRIALFRQREEVRERNVAVVNHLHNVVANDLSYIAMVANSQDDELWNRVRSKADEAFSSTHNIIRLLNNDYCHHLLDDFPRISDIIDYEQDSLAAVGCDGVCDCSEFDDAAISSEVRSVLSDVIKEVFGNIRKHADYSGQYSFTLRLNAKHDSHPPVVELLQSNVVSSQEARYSKGRGLEILRRELDNVNGDMRIAKSGNMWRMHITIAG